MIADYIENIKTYRFLGRNFAVAAEFAEKAYKENLPAGHYDIDGERVFANVFDRELTVIPEGWEVHRRYADIQMVLEGDECIGYFPVHGLSEPPVFESGSDCATYTGLQGSLIALGAGEYIIAMPQDVHMPNHPGRSAGRCRKLVIKVLLDGFQAE